MMLNENNSHQILTEAFESGYSNAANSLALMINDKVGYETYCHASHPTSSLSIADIHPQYEDESLVLLTTEIFGDVFGKSYLFLTQEDYDVLTRNVGQSKDPKINFHHEFLKEVDNILSAAVITRLSNKLKRKMYGDIPIWVGPVDNSVTNIITSDFQERADEIFVNTIFFKFDKAPSVKPLFIWIMDIKTVMSLEEKAIL